MQKWTGKRNLVKYLFWAWTGYPKQPGAKKQFLLWQLQIIITRLFCAEPFQKNYSWKDDTRPLIVGLAMWNFNLEATLAATTLPVNSGFAFFFLFQLLQKCVLVSPFSELGIPKTISYLAERWKLSDGARGYIFLWCHLQRSSTNWIFAKVFLKTLLLRCVFAPNWLRVWKNIKFLVCWKFGIIWDQLC